ncbi:MAG: hemolysin family protein, partial [Oscillospiraceae bacterium]
MGANIGNIVVIIILVSLSAFFSSSETAFASVNRIRVKNRANMGDKRAKKAMKVIENFDTALSAVLIGNNIVNIAAASIGSILFVNLLGKSGVAVSTIVLTIVVLVFGEVVPKSMAKQNPEKVLFAVSGILNVIMIVFKPIVFVLVKIKDLFTRNLSDGEIQPTMTEDELKCIIEEIEDEGVLNECESELVQSAIDFDDITVSEILTPRVDVVGVDINENAEVIKDIILKTGFSRIPVFSNNIDNIVGIINEKDFMRQYIQNKNVNIKTLVQPVTFVPPKKRIAQLMKDIQHEKTHIAIVTDQYGGTLGIITLEDIIEELVGEIWDESDRVVTEITNISNNIYRVNGDMNVYDMFEKLEIDDM